MFRRHGSKVLGCAAAALAGLTVVAPAEGDARGICTNKLLCHRNVPPPRTPAVLVSCGSFNPPTVAHLRMFDLATSALTQRGYDVWGCYMSPVADTYGKKGLAPVAHRVEMCRLAASDTDNVMVDAWEAAQPRYTRTLQVLRHVAESLQDLMQPHQQQQQQQAPHPQQQAQTNGTHPSSSHPLQQGEATAAQPALHDRSSDAAPAATSSSTHAGTHGADSSAPGTSNGSSSSSGDCSSGAAAAVVPGPPQPRVMLLCGADLLASMTQPGVWRDPDVILRDHGVVCVCRAGSDVDQLLQQPGSVLHKFRDHIIVVQEPVWNEISSTKVRQLLAEGQPVRYLVPDAVLRYIQQQGLFKTSPQHGSGMTQA